MLSKLSASSLRFAVVLAFVNICGIIIFSALSVDFDPRAMDRSVILTLESQHMTHRSIIYLHVGKTGGSTLDKVLPSNCEWYGGRKNIHRTMCLHRLRNNTALSRQVKRTVHASEVRQGALNGLKRDGANVEQNITSFLFTVRNPVDRAVSAFNMHHVDNTPRWPKRFQDSQPLRIEFYKKCFSTISSLAQVLGNSMAVETEIKNGTDCLTLGRDALLGEGHIFQGGPHLFFNYKKYYDVSIGRHTKKEVLALRTEYLWEDVAQLNAQLGGDESKITEEMKDTFVSFGSAQKPVRSGLYTAQERRIICCHLSQDNSVFEAIVRRAVNLDGHTKETYLQTLYDDCDITENTKRKYSVEGPFDWSLWRSSFRSCSMP